MRNKRRAPALVLAVVILALGAGGFFYLRARQAKNDTPVIKTAKVERGTVSSSISGNGVLQALTTVEVKSNVGGQVVQLAVDEGDRVAAGQLIARIDPADTLTTLEQQQADLQAAQSRVSQAEQQRTMLNQQNRAQVQSAEQAVEAARLRLAQAEDQAELQGKTSATAIVQAEQGLNAAKVRLAQAEEQARVQPQLSDAAIKQAESSLASAESTLKQTKNVLIPQKLSQAQTSYDQAKANYDYAVKDLARQKGLLEKGFVSASTVDTAEQRQRVTKAQLDDAKEKLATVKNDTEEDLQAAQARVNQAEAALRTAKANRTQDALKQRDVEAAQASVKQAEAEVQNARDNQRQIDVKRKEVAAARAALKQAQASLASARANLAQDGIREGDIVQARAQVVRNTAAVKNAQTQLDYTTITAPRAGIVIKKYIEEGSIIPAARSSVAGGTGVTLVEIADTSRMFAVVNVDETDIAQIAVGQNVDITVDAYPDELFDGTVTKISPQAVEEQSVTTVPVTVEVDMPDGRLKPGMNVTCDFVTARVEDVLMIPNEAIKETDDGSTVRVMEHGVMQTRPVEIGLLGNENAEVKSGLQEGDEIVTEVIEPEKPGNAMGGGGMGGGSSRGGGRGGMRMMRGPF